MKPSLDIFSFEFKNRTWLQITQIGTGLLAPIIFIYLIFNKGFIDSGDWQSLLFWTSYALFFFWFGTRPSKNKSNKKDAWQEDILDADIETNDSSNKL